MTPGATLERPPQVATQPDAGAHAPAPPPLKPGAARTRLLLEGPIVSTLLRLAAPNVVVNVVVIAVTATVDAHFVGRLDAGALAGLSLVFPLLMLMQQMANGTMGGAVASAVARAIGAGRRDDASALVVHALVIAAGMAAVFTSLLLIAGPGIYALMGGSGTTLAAAVEYSNTIFAGAIVYWVLGALTSVVRGTGQPAVLAAVYAGAELLHLGLVPALVFGIGPVPALGITGAALATVTSFAMATLVLAWYVAAGRTAITVSLRDLRLSRRLFADILHVGAPMSLQPILNNLSLATLTGFVGALGPAALAGFGAAVRLEYVLVPLTFGFGASVQAMVGTNIGAGRSARAARIAWVAGAVAAGVTGSIGVVAAVWPSAWISLFNATPAAQLFAASYLCVVSLTYSFLGLGATLSSAFQATGKPLWPLLALVGRVLVVATGGWVAIHVLNAGLAGLGIVAAAGLIVYGSGLAIAFRSGAWKVTRTLSRAAAAVALVVGVAAAAPAAADEVQILSAAAMQSAFPDIAREFERVSGHRLAITYGTIGAIRQRVLAGERADVVIGSTVSMPDLVRAGKIVAGSELTLCRSGIGMVVPSGTPALRISSVDDFTRAVLEARVVIYADPIRGGAAGVHVGAVFARLGIAPRLTSQITLAAGGDVTEVTLAQGVGALGLTQISEIVAKPGADFVGPLPDEIQNYTVFVAGTPPWGPRSDAANAFMTFMMGSTARAAMQAKGMHVD